MSFASAPQNGSEIEEAIEDDEKENDEDGDDVEVNDHSDCDGERSGPLGKKPQGMPSGGLKGGRVGFVRYRGEYENPSDDLIETYAITRIIGLVSIVLVLFGMCCYIGYTNDLNQKNLRRRAVEHQGVPHSGYHSTSKHR